MKVKKLEWVENYQESSSQQFIITHPNYKGFPGIWQKNYMSLLRSWGNFKAEKTIGEYETLEEAKEACQKHYEEFIISQILED